MDPDYLLNEKTLQRLYPKGKYPELYDEDSMILFCKNDNGIKTAKDFIDECIQKAKKSSSMITINFTPYNYRKKKLNDFLNF